MFCDDEFLIFTVVSSHFLSSSVYNKKPIKGIKIKTDMLRQSWHYLYCSLIVSDDDFVTRTRKMITAVLLIAMIAFPYSVVETVGLVDSGRILEGICHIIASIASLAATLKNWLHVKRTLNVDMRLFSITYTLHNIYLLFLHCQNPGFDYTMSAMCALIVVIICRIDQRFLVTTVSIILVMNYNRIFAPETGYFIAFTQDNSISLMDSIVHNTCVNILFMGSMIAYFIHRSASEYDRLTRKNQRALAMTQAIAEALVSYDTDEATKVLSDYRNTAGADVDVKMGDVLSQIIRNLESYRPHLPNYLLMRTFDESEDDETNDVERTTTLVADDRTAPTPPPGAFSSGGMLQSDDGSGGSGCVVDDDLYGRNNTLTAPEIMSVLDITTDVTPEQTAASRLTPKKHSKQSSSSQSSSLVSVGLLSRRVTLGMVYAPLFSTTALLDVPSASAFVDKLHMFAERTVAIVHGHFGDHIVVSWNTARLTSQHEVKAASFLLQCRAEASPCVGAITAGTAAFAHCGTRQVVSALKPCLGSVVAPSPNNDSRVWSHRLEHMLHEIAVPVGVCVCDDDVALGISHRFRVRAFSAFVEGADSAAATAVIERPVFVHEIVGERSMCANEEWMYAMQQEAANDVDELCRQVTDVTRLAASGNVAVAADMLDVLMSSRSAASGGAVLRYLADRLSRNKRRRSDDDGGAVVDSRFTAGFVCDISLRKR
eukprot:PhM_4_TR2088/c0_g1_i2/m.72264